MSDNRRRQRPGKTAQPAGWIEQRGKIERAYAAGSRVTEERDPSNDEKCQEIKAVFHAQAQALIGGKKKDKRLQIEALEKEVGALEAQLPGNQSEELCWQLPAKKANPRDLARKYDQTIKRRLYDIGDEASKLLVLSEKRDQ
ncbi:hypothetical protein NDU88_004108 [Pleurodeles waltl]|uniref:Uncharacterized protein n=1 Tax=Pleurodeles waltl TaxID=8319 RepID=A0AAV7WU52_PLEWA|nr:hypothetical protein NDU88_004108 [Pleurodeles waltl]